MTPKEQLQMRVDKLKEVKAKVILAQQEWQTYNQEFKAWIQKEIGVSDQQGELHLAEILTLWSAKHDNSPKIII